jgi:enoyl-CoA hydratase/carnithine racemase
VARVSTDDAPAYTDIRFEVDGAVAVITLNRPEVMNAFSGGMGQQVCDAFRRCDADDSIRAVVLTGEGRAFCAGADFSKGAAVFGAPSNLATFSADPFTFPAWRVRKPVIAAVNGHAIGLGMTMTLHCDFRIMARKAKYGIVQNRRGVMPDAHSHWTLPRIVGHARAVEILLTGKQFDGDDAERWGLANETLDAPEVLPRAMALAREIAVNTAPVSIGISKRLLWSGRALTDDEVGDLETRLHLHVMGRADAKEGVEAFLERREPRWSLTLSNDWPEWLDDELPGPAGS